MRIVVFSADPSLGSSPWWNMLLAMPQVTHILVCVRQRVTSPGAVARRLRRNVAKHGLIWLPYRAGVLALAVARLPFRRAAAPDPARGSCATVEWLDARDLHAPDVLARVQGFRADLGISLGAPVLRRALFALPRLGTINMHLGKVPEFRGAPVGFWELAQGAPSIGATIHWVDDGLDSGPVIADATAPIHDRDTLADVQDRAGELGTRLLRAVLERVARGEAVGGRPQAPVTHRANSFPTLRQRAALCWKTYRRRGGLTRQVRTAGKSLLMAVALYGFRPVRDLVRRIRRRHPVRVFTYHRVTHLCRDGMTVTPAVFEDQIRYIARHHDIVSLAEGLARIRTGARLRRPAAVVTFDDGYRSVAEAALPILARFGATGCCFVATDLVGTTGRYAHDRASPVRDHLAIMDWPELAELVKAGWHVESHTASHPRVSDCHGDALAHELEEPRHVLRRELGVPADVLAYPFGGRDDFSQEALDVAVAAGYTTVFANHLGENPTGSGSVMLSRIDLGGDHDRMGWRMWSHGVDLPRRGVTRPQPLRPGLVTPAERDMAACVE